MVCSDCLTAFFYEPAKVMIASFSLLVSIACFFLIRRQDIPQKTKIFLIYGNIFTFIFPVAYYTFNSSCMFYSGFFLCKNLQSIVYLAIIALMSSVLLGYLFAPKIIEYGNKTKTVSHPFLSKFVEEIRDKHGIRKIVLHIVDSAKPFAYSISTFKPHIFISIGLTELLSKKEIEAVLLHEIGHIKNRTSFLKFSALLHRIVSPFSHFTNFSRELDEEEKKADEFAVSEHGTAKHIGSAKSKIEKFFGAYR